LFSLFNDLLIFVWPLFLWAGLFVWYHLKIKENQKKYAATLKYIYLEVKIDDLNERSPFAMEQIFAALHAIYSGFSWGEKFAGKFVVSTSCEIVSLGGRVSYIFKIVDRYRNLFESAVFAQYPRAEIIEVEDYLKNLPKFYDPDTAEFNFWGTQLNKRKDGTESCYPIRTYGGFEHKEQDTFVDPLAAVLEVMSNLQPYELLASQIVFKPVPEDWKKGSEEILRKLRGNPKKKKTSHLDTLLSFPLEIVKGLFDIVLPGGPAAPAKPAKEEPPSLIQHLSEGQKQVIAAVEKQLDKISYEVKIRLFYLAPKDKFNKGLRVPEIIGAYRNFDEPSLNGLKPDLKKTWTDASYKYFESLEKPLRSKQKLVRMRKFLVAFKDRDHYKGSGKTYLNSEEMASIFHFPQVPNARVTQIERVQTVKSAPPTDLPIGDI
ncbi:MAG TPA: hypothetical protein VD998_02240, partial [Verrucomicrobiae bacterium]|nr:hypothetical protein [Verrucomicrobiae bacterium]